MYSKPITNNGAWQYLTTKSIRGCNIKEGTCYAGEHAFEVTTYILACRLTCHPTPYHSSTPFLLGLEGMWLVFSFIEHLHHIQPEPRKERQSANLGALPCEWDCITNS